MAVTFDTLPVYGMLGDGRLVQTNTYQDDGSDKLYIGGKIFYIDETASGATYEFYTRTGKIMTDVRVGDAPYAYKVTGTPSKDKYYVFNANAVTSKTWTYQADGSWVYNSLGTQDGIGKGKANTAIVRAADNGAYENFNTSSPGITGVSSIWNALKKLNDNADKGCNDWFVPSKVELEMLRNARDRDGNALTTLFSNTHIWSSFEHSTNNAWYWGYNSQSWYYSNKNYSNALVAVRGF